MSPKRTSWVRFDADDWLDSDTVENMNAAERGVYISALMLDWRHGGIPDDPEWLAKHAMLKLAAVKRAWPVLQNPKCFEKRSDGRIYNPRLQREREYVAERRASFRAGAELTNAKRRTGTLGEAPSVAPSDSLSDMRGDTDTDRDRDTEQQQIAAELIANDVSEAIADELAREKPEESRRQLQAFPDRNGIKDRGAFLVAAIRGEYPLNGASRGVSTEEMYREYERKSTAGVD